MGAVWARRGRAPGRRVSRAAVGVAAIVATVIGALPPATAASGRTPSGGSEVEVTVDAAHPGAGIDQGLVGANHVVAGSGPAMRAIGLRWARTDVSFEVTTGSGPAYNCATGAWDPSYLDSKVALDRAAGAQPELIVDYTPPCLATDPPSGTNPNYTPPDIGADAAKWKALVEQMALHEISTQGVRVFEIWNEPDGLFWTGGLNGYLQLYTDTATALERAATEAHAHIEVGGPALTDFLGLNTPWVSALAAKVVSAGLPLDFLSWHLYADDPDLGPGGIFPGGLCLTGPPPPGLPCWYNPHLDAAQYGQEAQQARAALAPYPSLHPVLWIDEWNVDAGFDARHDGPYDAAFVVAALDSAQTAGVERAAFYNVADPAGDRTQNFGLLRADLSPKPSYEAFRLWHALRGRQVHVALSPDQTGANPVGRVGAVASVGEDGTVEVLVYDFAPYDPTGGYGTSDPNPYDHAVTVETRGLGRGPYEVRRELIDASHAGSAVGGSGTQGRADRVSFTLAGEGVTLLTLTPAGAHRDHDARGHHRIGPAIS